MTYEDVLKKAKELMAPNCRVCPDCDGRVCKGEIPGLGGVGSGNSFTIAREYLKSIRVLLDLVYEPVEEIDTSVELFGRKFDVPFSFAPLAGLKVNYNGYFEPDDYIRTIVEGMNECGSFAFTPDGAADEMYFNSLPVIKAAGSAAVPTLKPWDEETFMKRVRAAEDIDIMALATDIDSCGLSILKMVGKSVRAKSAATIKKIVESTKVPFIIKGIMTAESAIKCAEAGCYGIVVSNHGGRVLEDSPAPASMLPEIKKAVGDSIKIFVDGGIRSGMDVFKCLALGADAVMIGRPYMVAAYGGKKEGIRLYTQKLLEELKHVMIMTACTSLSDISIDKIVLPQ